MLPQIELLTRLFHNTPGRRETKRCRSRQGGSRCTLFATFWQRRRVAAVKTQRIVRAILLQFELLTRRSRETPGQRQAKHRQRRRGGSRRTLFGAVWQRSRVAAVKTQRIVRTIEPPSRHIAIASPSCRAVPVASLRRRPVAPLGRYLPHRHSVACHRVATLPPATAPSSRRADAPYATRGTRRCLAQFAMSAARPSPGPGSTGRSASCG